MTPKLRISVKRKCRKLTFWGWLLVLLILYLIYRIFLGDICAYLSVNDPIAAKTLVVEGWVDDHALKDAVDFYQKNNYRHLIITGIPITQRKDFVKFKNTAEAASAMIKSFGFTDSIYKAVIPTTIFIDRTYNTAVSTRILFEQHPHWLHSFNIFSVGVHARRTRLMFDRAFGKKYRIGIISDVDHTFDPDHWWRSSKGFRNVSNEFVAFSYVWAFFHPDYSVFKKNLLNGFYVDTVEMERKQKDLEVADSIHSPLDSATLTHFKGLHYFSVDANYRIRAKLVVDTTGPVFDMATNTARKPRYRVYGHLHFRMHDTICQLTVYQNMDYIHDSVWGNYLFVPFRDKTCGKESHAAGRYIDMKIVQSDSVRIDFNRAYNPYCAYADRWSCPLVPPENWLNVSVFAGEKKLKENH